MAHNTLHLEIGAAFLSNDEPNEKSSAAGEILQNTSVVDGNIFCVERVRVVTNGGL